MANQVAIVVLADTETLGDLGRVVNALETVKEFQEAGDVVQLIFDGAGTKWLARLTQATHSYRELFQAVKVKGAITGACEYCADAFGVTESVKAAGVPLLGEYDRHPSLRKLVTEGYQVITF